jgi:hypothetical protein
MTPLASSHDLPSKSQNNTTSEVTSSPLPYASIENEYLRVEYLTTTGPRIIGLYIKGVEGNLLAVAPQVHWSTPYGEYYIHGGHRLWVAPEDPLYICPEPALKVITEKDKVTLQSEVDASGLEKEISFHLNENYVSLTHRVTWHGKEPVELAPWAITQLRLGGIAILPLPCSDGLLPNRNLVFWPYSHVEDRRLEFHDDLILIYGSAAEQALKIGGYNSHGWIAYLLSNALFVKRFSAEPMRGQPDMGSNVEAYVRDICIELETLGNLRSLQPQETMTYEETWEVSTGEFSTALEDARIISRQLSLK